MELFRHRTSVVECIKWKFIVAQNVQKNKQMDSPSPTREHPSPPSGFIRHNEAEFLNPMTTASPMVQAKRMVILRDNTYPISASLNN